MRPVTRVFVVYSVIFLELEYTSRKTHTHTNTLQYFFMRLFHARSKCCKTIFRAVTLVTKQYDTIPDNSQFRVVQAKVMPTGTYRYSTKFPDSVPTVSGKKQ